MRSAQGRFELFEAPGAKATIPTDINNRGEVVGITCDASPCASRVGFLRDVRGRFTTIRVPGSVETQTLGVNDRGQVVGSYLDRDGTNHGYLWQRGRFTTIDVPDATLTQVTGVNDRGDMVGVYADADGSPHGFFRSARGRITAIDAPDAAFTTPFDINNRRQIVGFTSDGTGLTADVHGFVLHRPGGLFTPIDVTGAPRTLASGIDDRGRIVGAYENPDAMPSAHRGAATPPTLMPRTERAPLLPIADERKASR